MNLSIKIDSDLKYKNINRKALQEEKKIEINISYISNFKSAKILRDIVSYISKEIGINKLWEKRLILIIDELNNNAIEYGTKYNDYNNLIFNFTKEKNNLFLKIEVRDCGNGKKPKTAKQMEELRENRKKIGFKNHNSIRGRGLFMIIEKLVDKLYFKDLENGGLSVIIEKSLEI